MVTNQGAPVLGALAWPEVCPEIAPAGACCVAVRSMGGGGPKPGAFHRHRGGPYRVPFTHEGAFFCERLCAVWLRCAVICWSCWLAVWQVGAAACWPSAVELAFVEDALCVGLRLR